ncbi:MAG: hypothetical protein GX855_07880 [Firmicutes bacterium]|nr:hypothetical protein [Bacillota bacterium]
MARLSLIVAICLVVALSGWAAAFEPHDVDFAVHVEPWVVLNMPNTADLLTISDGIAKGEVDVRGTLICNFPVTLGFASTRFSETDANKFFKYTLGVYEDEEYQTLWSSLTHTAGGPSNKIAGLQGVNYLSIRLKVAIPSAMNWYDLTAGSYSSTATITISAPTQ